MEISRPFEAPSPPYDRKITTISVKELVNVSPILDDVKVPEPERPLDHAGDLTDSKGTATPSVEEPANESPVSDDVKDAKRELLLDGDLTDSQGTVTPSVEEPANESPVPERVTDPNYQPPPGHVGNLTDSQSAALEALRKEVEAAGKFDSERHNDPTLLRFLRARKFDVKKATAMLIEYEQWRVSFGVDDIVKNLDFKEKAEVDKYYSQYYHKTDKDGRPVYIEQLGKLDVTKLYKLTTKERMLQRLVFEYEKFLNERLPACSTAVRHPVETSCTIFDLKGVSILKYYNVSDYVSEATSISQNYYPETMGKFYIINAPWGFKNVWGLIQKFLDPATVAKIHILGQSDYKELIEQIPAENLPKVFGGECQCPGGCSLSDAGPWNPSDA